MVMTIKADMLFDGEAEGNVLALQAPICFWGGLDPKTGQITDPHHPNHQAEVADKILTVPEIVGSSSSSQILLESMYQGRAPAAIILGKADAIIAMAVLVGQEMDFGTIPILHSDLDQLALASHLTIRCGGNIELLEKT